jgi:hypothetical protein
MDAIHKRGRRDPTGTGNVVEDSQGNLQPIFGRRVRLIHGDSFVDLPKFVMLPLNDADTMVCFHGDGMYLNPVRSGEIAKLAAGKARACVRVQLVWRPGVYVDPTTEQSSPKRYAGLLIDEAC